MFSKIITLTLAATATALVFTTINLIEDISALRESVNLIEEAAHQIDADMETLRRIADEQRCYEERGEWDAEHGCFLQEVDQ